MVVQTSDSIIYLSVLFFLELKMKIKDARLIVILTFMELGILYLTCDTLN